MQVLADRYINDNQQEGPVWLHASMDGETGERRALVRSIEIQYKPQWFGAGESTLNIPLALVIEREPYWERTAVRSLPQYQQSSGQAIITYDYTAAGSGVSAHDIVGDIGARIRFWKMEASASIEYFWMGIRSANKHPSLANFVPVWSLKDGTLGTDVSTTADTSAHSGTRITVTESAVNWDDGNWHDVVHINLDDVTANEDDQLGKFLWLLRGRVSSAGSTTWQVRLKWHYGTGLGGDPTNPNVSNIVEITHNSDYQIDELGVNPIGHRDIHAIIATDLAYTEEDLFSASIEAKRITGSADLWLDCLLPVPADEGFCYIDSSAVSGYDTMFGFSPEGSASVITFSTSIITSDVIDPINFRLPPGDGRIYMVIAGWGSGDVKINDLEGLQINNTDDGKYYECWLSLRGSE
ncbi:MAG: hypothetical protein ACYSQZ_09520 [Planctomycetota bacterium]